MKNRMNKLAALIMEKLSHCNQIPCQTLDQVVEMCPLHIRFEQVKMMDLLREIIEVEEHENKYWSFTADPNYTYFIMADLSYHALPNEWLNLIPPMPCQIDYVFKIDGGDFDSCGNWAEQMREDKTEADREDTINCFFDEILEEIGFWEDEKLATLISQRISTMCDKHKKEVINVQK